MLALLNFLDVSASAKLVGQGAHNLPIPTSLILPLISCLAIWLLIGMSIALGFRQRPSPLSVEEIAPLLDGLSPGAKPARFARDISGLHAIVELDNGQLWVARRMGADIGLRNLRRDQIKPHFNTHDRADTQNRADCRNLPTLDIDSNDIGFGRLRLRFAEKLPDWLNIDPSSRLRPQ